VKAGARRGCALCLVAPLTLLLARSLWLPLIGGFLIVADPLAPADAVVPLGGGERDRVTQAVTLFRQGYVDWFIVTNTELDLPGIRDSWAALVRREATWRGVAEEQIVDAPGTVTTTYNEALAVRGLASARGWRSLIIATDPYHTRRARLIFRDVFRDTGVLVIVRPVDDAPYRAGAWWHTEEGLRDTWTEFLKLVLYVAGYR
jgi:uncharacterized SAM-binding protein YcdF (DUF218 family)